MGLTESLKILASPGRGVRSRPCVRFSDAHEIDATAWPSLVLSLPRFLGGFDIMYRGRPSDNRPNLTNFPQKSDRFTPQIIIHSQLVFLTEPGKKCYVRLLTNGLLEVLIALFPVIHIFHSHTVMYIFLHHKGICIVHIC